MVEAACGRKGGGNVSHAKGDEKREYNTDWPDDACGSATDGADAELKRSDAAGEDADDGKGNGKVGKAAHSAEQFLGVAHFVKESDVVRARDGRVGSEFGF